MGSTVILVLEPGRAALRLQPGERVRVGQAIGQGTERAARVG
jgi:hypothetical protein